MNDPVVVVGAGPVGLTAACELTRHGVPCRIFDPSPRPVQESRALAVHARTLEIFERMGIVDEALERGHRVHAANIYAEGERIVHVTLEDLDSPYPFILILPQGDTEHLLSECLEAQGVEVERRWRVTSLRDSGDSVEVHIENHREAEGRITTPWLIGCDGARSTVRKELGSSFDGVTHDERFFLADVRVDWELPRDEAHVFLGKDGPLAAFPLPSAGRWRWVLDASRAGNEEPTLEGIVALARERGVPAFTVDRSTWISGFRIHRRMVPQYRSGHCFLAGDAAHIHSPLGGQGMNTGIQDAFNLAWKLGLVTKRQAHPDLLDTYHHERHPVAQATLKGTDLVTRAVTLRRPIWREMRNHLATFLSSLEVVQRRLTRTLAELDVSYTRSSLVGEDSVSVFHAHLQADRTTEEPGFFDCLRFGSAPGPGERAPDVEIAGGEEPRHLFSFLQGPGHHLFLFDGAAATPEGYDHLRDLAGRIAERYGDLVTVFIVVPRETLPASLMDCDRVILDTDGSLHRRYGAESECLYLIRPDGYIGYRAQPANEDGLLRYLARWYPVPGSNGARGERAAPREDRSGSWS